MGRTSQGLKAGLAAGVIYGLMIGLLHLTTLAGCSSAQIAIISQKLVSQQSNASATAIFYDFDVVYYPMVYGIWALVYGVVYGVVFSAIYRRLPGSNSKSKGVVLGGLVFVIDAVVGPGFFVLYSCNNSIFPYITFAASVPATLLFGYLLGTFYDWFGRLEKEETEERKKRPPPEHWADALRKKKETANT